jgi:phosphate transport system substrate-binding protein
MKTIPTAVSTLIAAASLIVPAAQAQSQSAPAGQVEWVVPTTPTNKPQTAEQTEEGKRIGRALPAPEILQPTLDSQLPAYVPKTGLAMTGTFKGSASDVLVVLAQKWIEKFKTYYPNAQISINPPYAGSLGAVELAKDNLDFVFVSRELRPDDVKQFEARFAYAPLSVPISGGSWRHFGALDAVTFFVNKDNPLEQITYQQIDQIYSSTHLRGGTPAMTWGDLGLTGEWANKPIKKFALRPWNGFEEFVRQRVLSVNGKRGEWREDLAFEKLVFPVAKDVAADAGAIGYSGVAYLDAPVKVIPIVEHAGDAPQAPTYENVARATYPLSRLTFFNTNKAPNKPLPPVLEEFLRFVLSRDGQQVVLDQARYMPLRAGQADAAREMLGSH